MPEPTAPVLEDTSLDDVSLIDTPIALPTEDAPADAANIGKDDAAASPDKPQDASKSDANGTEAKVADKPADDADKPDEPPQPDEPPAPDPKEEQRLKAQQEYQNRQRVKSQIAEQLDQHYGPKTKEQLIEEGIAPEAADVQALREEIAYRDQRAAVAELNAGIRVEAVSASNDFPIFNPNSPNFDAEFTAQVDAAYQTAARVQTAQIGVDALGNPVEVIVNAEVPLYDFYKNMAAIHSRGESKGADRGQRETIQTMSHVEDPGGSSSANLGNPNDLDALEERLGDVSIL